MSRNWPQAAISSMVRQHPTHKPSAIWHTETQGEGNGPGSANICADHSRMAWAKRFFSASSKMHHPARLLSNARATREEVARPKASLMKTPASTRRSRSMPVSMPMPCSK